MIPPTTHKTHESMRLHVVSIPETGQFLDFDQNTPCLRELLRERFSEIYQLGDEFQGKIELHRTFQNVTASGYLNVKLRPECARCGSVFEMQAGIPLQRHWVPMFSGPREEGQAAAGEIELQTEDLECSFYEGEEIDLGELIAEEIHLALPMQFLCQESCRGLCPRCGQNLNRQVCACPLESKSSPFEVLKDLREKL